MFMKETGQLSPSLGQSTFLASLYSNLCKLHISCIAMCNPFILLSWVCSTLSLDGSPDDGIYNPHPGPSLMDSYDYVMHGRVFGIKHIENQRIEIQASFGGLLMKIKGQQSLVDAFSMDMMSVICICINI